MTAHHISHKHVRLFAALAAIPIAVTLTGCSAGQATSAGTTPDAFEHVHGIAFDPNDDQLTIATHEGIYKLQDTSTNMPAASGPVGDLDIDAMGFTLVDGTAYASGHPGPNTPQSFGTPNLGLISSSDQGKTWTTLSLAGVADFHALAVDPDNSKTILGLSSSDATVYRSDDGGISWDRGAALTARELAIPANSSGTVYATTDTGLARSKDGGFTFQPVPDAPALFLITSDGAQDGRLAGIDTEGNIWRETREGGWTQEGTIVGTPQAMAAIPGTTRLVIADDRGISSTEDYGRSWDILVPAP